MTRSFRRKNQPRMPLELEPVERRQFMSVSVKYVDVPISAAARAADSTLNDLRTVDVQLQVTNDDWLASDLKLTLTAGSYYNPRSGSNTPLPQTWATLPYLQHDTFVSGPGFSTPSILGRKEGSGAAVFSSTEVNVAFGDLEDTGAGTFTIARLTMTRNATGVLTGSVFLKSDPSTSKAFSANFAPPTPKITGKVYNDANGNGRQDSGEANLNRWQVYLDNDNDGRLDSNEVSVRTNSSGVYTFNNPGNKTHRVRLTLQNGFRRTQPSGGSYAVAISPGVVGEGKNFGVTQLGRISGLVFRDSDGDRAKDSGESGMSGWRVFIDRDNDGRFDSNESNMRSASNGSFQFDNLSAGTYRLRITQVGGFTRTTPTSGVITVNLAAGADVGNQLFGQRPV